MFLFILTQLSLTKLKIHLSHLQKEMFQLLIHLACPAPIQDLGDGLSLWQGTELAPHGLSAYGQTMMEEGSAS